MSKTVKFECIFTGKQCVFSTDYLSKKIKQFGSIEQAQKYYICRDVKTLIKRGYSIQEIVNILDIDINNVPEEDVIKKIYDIYGEKHAYKTPTLNTPVSGFTYNKTDPDVEKFMKQYIIKK